MKVLVLGAQVSTGIAKKTGTAFKINSVFVAQPIENVEMEKYQKRGSGFEQVEMQATDDGLAEIMALGTFPAEYDLRIDGRARMGKLEMIISGIEKSKK